MREQLVWRVLGCSHGLFLLPGTISYCSSVRWFAECVFSHSQQHPACEMQLGSILDSGEWKLSAIRGT